jgi:hypothetical protein
MIRIAHVELESISAYSQSRNHGTPRLENEPHEAYRLRTWREQLHYNEHGEVFIPPMASKNGLTAAAKRLGMPVPGRGRKTYLDFFKSAILCPEPLMLGINKDDVQSETLFLPAMCKPGSGRVWKTFPVIPNWRGTAEIIIVDATITNGVFETHFEVYGKYIGVGRFRPEVGGFYGRFQVLNIVYSEMTETLAGPASPRKTVKQVKEAA